mmetsp:Transcript_39719/g.105141  ORF Transcript_39719/g.105141 Transcript_39719/m.105141 type:complete len:413 (-) Transcript_39719:298-1536(-)
MPQSNAVGAGQLGADSHALMRKLWFLADGSEEPRPSFAKMHTASTCVGADDSSDMSDDSTVVPSCLASTPMSPMSHWSLGFDLNETLGPGAPTTRSKGAERTRGAFDIEGPLRVENSEQTDVCELSTDSRAGPSLIFPPGLAPSVPPPPGLEALTDAALISGTLASIGSALHASGTCKPCAWFWKPGGCRNGQLCRHCHLCPEGELKLRKRAKVDAIRAQLHEGTRVAGHTRRDFSDMGSVPPGRKAKFEGTVGSTSEVPVSPAIGRPDILERAPQCVERLGVTGLSASSWAVVEQLRTDEIAGLSPSAWNAVEQLRVTDESLCQSTWAAMELTPWTAELPSHGSLLHSVGLCRPCAWYWKSPGCTHGRECFHCHLCPDGEVKARRKAKNARMHAMEAVRRQPRAVPAKVRS